MLSRYYITHEIAKCMYSTSDINNTRVRERELNAQFRNAIARYDRRYKAYVYRIKAGYMFVVSDMYYYSYGHITNNMVVIRDLQVLETIIERM